MSDLFGLNMGAVISDCGLYRYALWRIWDESLPLCVFIMLNPSTADHETDDATITRCKRRAMALGCGGLWVANLFALRSKDRSALKRAVDPVGPDNDRHLVDAAKRGSRVICAWGADGSLNNRDRDVVRLLKACGVKLQALAVNGDGSPAHPLYLDYGLAPTDYHLSES